MPTALLPEAQRWESELRKKRCGGRQGATGAPCSQPSPLCLPSALLPSAAGENVSSDRTTFSSALGTHPDPRGPALQLGPLPASSSAPLSSVPRLRLPTAQDSFSPLLAHPLCVVSAPLDCKPPEGRPTSVLVPAQHLALGLAVCSAVLVE